MMRDDDPKYLSSQENAGFNEVSKLTVVFIAYFLAARLGLAAPFTSWNVSPVWPPSGVALAAVLVWGWRMWPAIGLGALLANYLSPIPHLAALGIAIGNTSGAMLGAYLLRRIPGFQTSLGRLRDVLGLVTLGAIVSPIVAACCGTLTLSLFGIKPWSAASSAWLVWWLGDAMGVLIVAPLVLTTRGYMLRSKQSRTAEFLFLTLALVLTCLLVFDSRIFHIADDVLAFSVFPFVIWAAIRFGIGGASFATFVVAATSVWETAMGSGPFVGHRPLHNAILLQLYLAVISVTGMVLSAVVSEREQAETALGIEQRLLEQRKRAERRLVTQYEVTKVLGESSTLDEAVPRILAAVGSGLDWQVGGLWRLDPDQDVVRCVFTWLMPGINATRFEAATRTYTFPRGVGLPGRIWQSAQPEWIPDVNRDPNFPRAPFAELEGLHGAFGFPVMLGRDILGVVEFFSCDIREPDQDLLDMVAAIGSQIGQFIERKRAEEALHAAEKLAAAGRMAASVAHEINNPLEAVTNLLYLLSSDPQLPEDAHEYVTAAEKEVARVAHIAQQTLAFYRDTSVPGPVDLPQLMDSLLEVYHSRITSKAIRIEKRYEFSGEVRGTVGELRQVFSNLVVNALDACSTGGVVTIHVSRFRDWREDPRHDRVRVSVIDNGPGFAPGLRKKIFEPFFTTKVASGTGLGLWIAHGIVQKHGGSIQVRSRTEAGRSFTCFSVFLPADAIPNNRCASAELAA